MPLCVLHRPAPLLLSEFTALRRQSIRPVAEREVGYEAAFDDDTLAFDAFWDNGCRQIRLICPPFLNLTKHLADMQLTALPSGSPATFTVRTLDRNTQVHVNAPPGTTSLRLESNLGRAEVRVGANHAEIFSGRRVLATQSKDNKIEWIMDWVRFHRDVHGADAVLIYDNGTTAYAMTELSCALSSLSGIERVVIVEWPFKYGPQGTQDGRNWESFYCQLGMLEHARYRYLAEARSVVQGDVDELVVSASSQGIFHQVEQSLFGVQTYYGSWVVGSNACGDGLAGIDVRHRHIDLMIPPNPKRRAFVFEIDANRCPTKWSVVPSRCPSYAQWRTHRIRNWVPAYAPSSASSYRHFRPINTNWKYDRGAAMADRRQLIFDARLRALLDQVRWSE